MAPAPSERKAARTVVVLGDSLSICDETGPRLFSSQALYPAKVARLLGEATASRWRPVVFARPGWSLYWANRELDSREDITRAIEGASAVIIAIGAVDGAAVIT